MAMLGRNPHELDSAETHARAVFALLGSRVTRNWIIGLTLFIAALALVVVWWSAGAEAERRALLRMRPEDRRALYQETTRNADAVCAQAHAERALRDRCIDAAAFLRLFPECDDACMAFARSHQQGPTR